MTGVIQSLQSSLGSPESIQPKLSENISRSLLVGMFTRRHLHKFTIFDLMISTSKNFTIYSVSILWVDSEFPD